MFIPWQSYEGLQVTVHLFKEVCKFLLEQGISYILSERFCQDDLETKNAKKIILYNMTTNGYLLLCI